MLDEGSGREVYRRGATDRGPAGYGRVVSSAVVAGVVLLVLVLAAACGGDDEEPSVDLSTLNVRACASGLTAETACDESAEGVWRPVGVCLDVDADAAARRICEAVRFRSARPSLSGEVEVQRFGWSIDLSWSLILHMDFPESCFEEEDLTCREVRDILVRTVHSRSVCVGTTDCRCTISMSGRERTSGSILMSDEGAVTLDSGFRYHTCRDGDRLRLRRINRGADDPDVTFELRSRR